MQNIFLYVTQQPFNIFEELYNRTSIYFPTFYYMFDLLKAFYTLSALDMCKRYLS